MRKPSAKICGVILATVILSGCGSAGNWFGNKPQSRNLDPQLSPDFGVLAEGQTPDWSKRVVFTARRNDRQDGNDEIFTANLPADSVQARVLRHTMMTSADREPTWRPDHKRIVYVRTRRQGFPPGTFSIAEEKTDLYIMNADGSEITLPAKVVRSDYSDEVAYRAAIEKTKKDPLWKADNFVDGDKKGVRVAYPRYSSDGRTLAVAVYMSDGSSRLFLAAPDGTGTPLKLTSFGGPATWNSDGTQLIFSAKSPKDGKVRLYAVKATGGEPQALTEPPLDEAGTLNLATPNHFHDVLPLFAPDNASVVFSRSSPVQDIANGTGRRPKLLRLLLTQESTDALVSAAKDANNNPLPLETLSEGTEDAAAGFSPDRTQLLVTRRNSESSMTGTLVLINLTDRTTIPLTLTIDNQALAIGAACLTTNQELAL